jgi:hypothetical protein
MRVTELPVGLKLNLRIFIRYPENVSHRFGNLGRSLPVATAYPPDEPDERIKDVEKKATRLIDEDFPESVSCIH